MKNKLLKMGLLSFTLLFALLFTNKVGAESCKVYKDYYYFLDTTDESKHEADLGGSDSYIKTNTTFVPAGEASNSKMIDQFQIEVVKDGGSITNKEMNLDNYYDNLKKVYAGEEKQLTTPKGVSTINIYKEKETEEEVIRHILHGKWYVDGEEYKNSFIKEIVKIDNQKLINSSIIPTGELNTFANIKGTGIKFEKGEQIFDVTVERSILKSDIENLVPVDVSGGGEYHKKVLNAPGVYYIEYNYCTYTGTINYYYADTKEKVEFEDNSANPYIKSGLEAGSSKEVTSPTLKNCTPDQAKVNIEIDKENPQDVSYDVYYTCKKFYNAKIDYVFADTGKEAADSYYKDNLEDGYTKNVESPKIEGCVTKDKEVKVNIEGKNFYKKVEYTCEVEENEKTGSLLIYIAWLIGLGALGYSTCYFIKLKKSKK